MLQADSMNKNFYANQDVNYVTTVINLVAFLMTKFGGLVITVHWSKKHPGLAPNHDSALDMVASEGRALHFSYALFLCTFLEHGK